MAAQVLADTGRRVGKILSLTQADLDRSTGELTLAETKNGQTHNAYLVPEVVAQIQSEFDPLFPSATNAQKPIGTSVLRHVLKRLLRQIGVKDVDRLDTHSIRRRAPVCLDRNGVSRQVGKRIGGWETDALYDHYARNSVDQAHIAAAGVLHKASARLRKSVSNESPKISKKSVQALTAPDVADCIPKSPRLCNCAIWPRSLGWLLAEP
jgi:integrase